MDPETTPSTDRTVSYSAGEISTLGQQGADNARLELIKKDPAALVVRALRPSSGYLYLVSDCILGQQMVALMKQNGRLNEETRFNPGPGMHIRLVLLNAAGNAILKIQDISSVKVRTVKDRAGKSHLVVSEREAAQTTGEKPADQSRSDTTEMKADKTGIMSAGSRKRKGTPAKDRKKAPPGKINHEKKIVGRDAREAASQALDNFFRRR